MAQGEAIIKKLIASNTTLAAVESCTGGYLSYLITQTPGSSKIFKGSLIAYSLEAKHNFFKLNKSLLTKTQGISAKVACALAKKARKLFNCDIAMAVVGAAGPGSINNIPAGTVHIAINSRKKKLQIKLSLTGNRKQITQQAARKTLELLKLI